MLELHPKRTSQVLEATMQAHPGDTLVVEGKTVGQPTRHGTILEVPSPEGLPPYRVRWEDGHEALTFPGPDAHIATGTEEGH